MSAEQIHEPLTIIIDRYAKGTDPETAKRDAEIFIETNYFIEHGESMDNLNSSLEAMLAKSYMKKWENMKKLIQEENWKEVSYRILSEGVDRVTTGVVTGDPILERRGQAIINLASSIIRF